MPYIYVVERANDGSYSAFVPDLPGCTTSGDSAEEVRLNIKEAVAIHIESLREHNEAVPEPMAVVDAIYYRCI